MSFVLTIQVNRVSETKLLTGITGYKKKAKITKHFKRVITNYSNVLKL